MSNTAANNINYDTFTLSSSLSSFNAFQETLDPDSRTISRNGPNSGWNMVLFRICVLKLISNMNNYNQIPVLKPTNHYNPFYRTHRKECTATPNMGTNTAASMFSSTLLPTSQAAITTFSGQNSTSAVQSDLN
ncbi:hypothetical protein H5410_020474 [Solanum commersonii]|uniref:Uncharacterized protein n=1 Tax=Solanum commersonii TaxID=4109 RepID=A0A9J5Z8J1_SOLCO|nr:hypothetical protein H5410_020474 [Solanum commersonii]